MFSGKSFIYDQIASELFDLRILEFDTSGGAKESNAGVSSTLLQSWPLKRTSPFHFDVANNTPLEINLSIGSYNPRIANDIGKIEKWLLGRRDYKKFQIVQDDMADVYFNVIFDNASNIYVGNVFQGMALHGVCDAPWAWTFPQTKTYTFSGDMMQIRSFTFYNDSDDQDRYLYPKISFTTNNSADYTTFLLYNNTDDGRLFSFSNLSSNETITVDNDRQIITSSLGNLRLSDFNKNWFRLLSGNNNIMLEGFINSFSMTYAFARKIGG